MDLKFRERREKIKLISGSLIQGKEGEKKLINGSLIQGKEGEKFFWFYGGGRLNSPRGKSQCQWHFEGPWLLNMHPR